jgi:hypothetical protein
MGLLDKAKDMLMKNSDKAKGAVDKAGDMVDKKTGGKYAGQVDSVQDKAKDMLDKQAAAPATPPAEGEGKDIA